METRFTGNKKELEEAKQRGCSSLAKRTIASLLVAGSLIAVGTPSYGYAKQEQATHNEYVQEYDRYVDDYHKNADEQLKRELSTSSYSKEQTQSALRAWESLKETDRGHVEKLSKEEYRTTDKNNNYLKILPQREGDKKPRIELGVKDITSLDSKQLKYYQKHYEVDSINMHRYYELDRGETMDEQFVYTPETYKKLQMAIENKFGDLKNNKKLTEAEKVIIVTRRLSEQAEYDYVAARLEDSNNKRAIKARNLEGVLLGDKTICAGYADAFKNAMAYLGIEAKEIRGNKDVSDITGQQYFKEQLNHNWNQVKVDGQWYNIDLTEAATNPAVLSGDNNPYLLVGDDEFNKDRMSHSAKEYTPMLGLSEKCLESYDREQLKKSIDKASEYENNRTKGKKNIVANIKEKFQGVKNKLFGKSQETLELNEGKESKTVANNHKTTSKNTRQDFLNDLSHNEEYGSLNPLENERVGNYNNITQDREEEPER